METEALLKRLQALEDAEQTRQRKSALDLIMSKYGDEFSGNEDFGYALVDELHNRGVDMSAADSVVKEILDQLRQEVSAAAEMLRVQINKVDDIKNKVADITEAVVAAEERTGEGVDDVAGVASDMPPVDEAAPDMPPVDEASMPPVEETPAEAPVPEAAPDMPLVDEASMPPVEETPAPDMPPTAVLSDCRLKRIKGIISDRRLKTIKKPVATKPVQKSAPANYEFADAIFKGLGR